ncbi:MAG: ACT domain-containing protein [Propionicimonas sp.]|uniref:glycine cleavage system protein R n=1 Tax=Propionicimonas sp. TaxID=1955623 RepID=UPI003D1469FF
MANLVLTVVGDDRAGLVAALADVVSAHGGNWEHSELAELAGTFAGIVVVSVPDDRKEDLTAAFGALDGLLTVTAHAGTELPAAEAPREIIVNVLGNDHPGIVRDISAVLSRHGVSIERLTSESREAPMSGGRLFEARVVAAVPPGADPAGIQTDLERLAAELLVDITLGE